MKRHHHLRLRAPPFDTYARQGDSAYPNCTLLSIYLSHRHVSPNQRTVLLVIIDVPCVLQ